MSALRDIADLWKHDLLYQSEHVRTHFSANPISVSC